MGFFAKGLGPSALPGFGLGGLGSKLQKREKERGLGRLEPQLSCAAVNLILIFGGYLCWRGNPPPREGLGRGLVGQGSMEWEDRCERLRVG